MTIVSPVADGVVRFLAAMQVILRPLHLSHTSIEPVQRSWFNCQHILYAMYPSRVLTLRLWQATQAGRRFIEGLVATGCPVDASLEATCSISALVRDLRDLRVMNMLYVISKVPCAWRSTFDSFSA